ncbi:MAG: class I SAM-dependent methyltransferase [Planctomycetaceae bacterium]|nr:class I SAM-dependent methyltransferase [Planctomycetaceae bacterium]
MTINNPPTRPAEPRPHRVVPEARRSGRGLTAPRVVACYSVLDYFMPACGFDDLTDGMFEGDPHRPYEATQARQAQVLLDRAGCGPGSRVLDIGCGYGRILKAAAARGARAWGITVSPEQVTRGRRAGLEVELQDYKHLGREWDERFDAVIANGSIEHFVQPADATAGRDDRIYRHMFATVHRLLDPCSQAGRFVTTVIHVPRRPDPNDWLRPPSDFPWGSGQFHFARLTQAFGGWYPVRGQLEACAQGYFTLVHEEDGTEDYRLTSEAWLAGVRRRLRSVRGLGVWLRALPVAVRHPVATARMFRCQLGSESWNWQFHGDPAPTLLLRQTWQRVN